MLNLAAIKHYSVLSMYILMVNMLGCKGLWRQESRKQLCF